MLQELSHQVASVLGILTHRDEGSGDASEMFVEIGYIIDKWQRASVMHESKAWSSDPSPESAFLMVGVQR